MIHTPRKPFFGGKQLKKSLFINKPHCKAIESNHVKRSIDEKKTEAIMREYFILSEN
jgi:hypothetical protein